jgi:hypothetical protein
MRDTKTLQAHSPEGSCIERLLVIASRFAAKQSHYIS